MKRKSQESLTTKDLEGRVGCVALIFSSDRDFLDYYRGMFIKLGFTPVTTTTPEEALAILRLAIVGLVIVDQGKKIFESQHVLERARETQQHAPVFVITRERDQNYRHEVLAMGAAACLDHPALPDDIAHALVTSDAREQRSAHRSHEA